MEKKENLLKSKLEIICPNCDKENTIKLSSEIKCKKCEEDLTKSKYSKFKKPIIGAMTAIMIGTPAAYQIGKHMHSEDRYPVATEYSIVYNCIHKDRRPLLKAYIKPKKAICVCALSNTMKSIDYDDYINDEEKFMDIFEQKAAECQ